MIWYRWACNDGDDDDDAGGHSERDTLLYYSGPGDILLLFCAYSHNRRSRVVVSQFSLYCHILFSTILYWIRSEWRYSSSGTVETIPVWELSECSWSEVSTPSVQYWIEYDYRVELEYCDCIHTGITNMNSGWFKADRPFPSIPVCVTAYHCILTKAVRSKRGAWLAAMKVRTSSPNSTGFRDQ